MTAASGGLCVTCGAGGAVILYSQVEGSLQRRAEFWVCRRCYVQITLFLFIVGDEGFDSVPSPRHAQWVNPWHRFRAEGESLERWRAEEDG